MNRSDDMRLYYILQAILDNQTIDEKTCLYLDNIRNEIRTLTEIQIRANKGRESMYSDIIGKYFLIHLLMNGRLV